MFSGEIFVAHSEPVVIFDNQTRTMEWLSHTLAIPAQDSDNATFSRFFVGPGNTVSKVATLTGCKYGFPPTDPANGCYYNMAPHF
jgi:hypothetical protein